MGVDLDAEREIDLARWRRALVALWWLPVAGLIIGAILGVLASFRGSQTYKATSLVSLGQPVAPGGALVNGFGTSPSAVQQIVNSPSAQALAEAAARMRPGTLNGQVSVSQISSVTSQGARPSPLIQLTVDGTRPAPTEDAVNALARLIVARTTANYVGVKIRTFQRTLNHVTEQIASVNKRLTVAARAERASKNLDPLQQLVVVGQEDNAETRLGNLIQQQEVLQQQMAFAKEVESAKIVTEGRAFKASPHSRNSSLIIGAVIGLILGAIAAIVAYGRFSWAPA